MSDNVTPKDIIEMFPRDSKGFYMDGELIDLVMGVRKGEWLVDTFIGDHEYFGVRQYDEVTIRAKGFDITIKKTHNVCGCCGSIIRD